MLGPYPANLNDAEILRTLLQDPNGLCKLLKENDIMVLDRGFRDVKAELELKKIRVLMPALKGKRKQLTTKESNESRYVTKIRWAVEAVHGILKQKYQLLDHKLDNKMLPKIGTYFRIASFINNQFGKRLQSDAEFSSEIIEKMRVSKDIENTLAAEAEEKGWLRKKLVFQSISSDMSNFPEMTIKDLTILFTETYQLSQAVSYLAEMIDKDVLAFLDYCNMHVIVQTEVELLAAVHMLLQ
ncbi:hypothetical protein DMN91_003288 [Ooceraea biroi]|uniref:DDE Tnp4 domain-containing protein n=1 Tax=Ooceraea biroi TaxID=2015173 RepID=A0A3L8DXV3_OOCBI|nr:hypothetical protein DMN91_003288 [Ooceraea biroi]